MAIIDLVQYLKIETPAEGGTQTDPFPTEANPSQDYGNMKGIVFDSVSGNRIEGVSGVQWFRDLAAGNTSGWTLTDLAQRLFGKTVQGGTPGDGNQLIWSNANQRWEYRAGSYLKTKAGLIDAGAFSGNPKKASVAFVSPFSVSGYAVALTGADARFWSYESRTVSGFVANSNANQALSNPVNWIASVSGESA
jgi:hypothetical protein